jgi:hypothetical protein
MAKRFVAVMGEIVVGEGATAEECAADAAEHGRIARVGEAVAEAEVMGYDDEEFYVGTRGGITQLVAL